MAAAAMLRAWRSAGAEGDWRSVQASQEVSLALAAALIRTSALDTSNSGQLSEAALMGFRIPAVPGNVPCELRDSE